MARNAQHTAAAPDTSSAHQPRKTMPRPTNLTVAILREIRDELRTTREELSGRLGDLSARLDATREELSARLDATREELSARISAVEYGLMDLAEQQRFVVQRVRVTSSRDRRLDAQLASLRNRVERIEDRLRPEE